jgi:hypothetical protein
MPVKKEIVIGPKAIGALPSPSGLSAFWGLLEKAKIKTENRLSL